MYTENKSITNEQNHRKQMKISDRSTPNEQNPI